MINHGVTTGALFIVVGIIYERLHTRDLAEAAGIGKAMPIFALFAGVFALSSLAFPGTNSFIGEFLVLSGGFKLALTSLAFIAAMICVVPGVVLAAAYMLRMLQKVAYGGTSNPDHSQLKDLGLREILTRLPLLVFVFWIGLHPEPFTRVLDASVKHLLEQTQPVPPPSAYAIRALKSNPVKRPDVGMRLATRSGIRSRRPLGARAFELRFGSFGFRGLVSWPVPVRPSRPQPVP